LDKVLAALLASMAAAAALAEEAVHPIRLTVQHLQMVALTVVAVAVWTTRVALQQARKTAALAQFASFGPAPLAHSHQQIRGTCNA
jgi:hypothetical protein